MWVGLHLVDQYVWSMGRDKTHIAKVFTIRPLIPENIPHVSPCMLIPTVFEIFAWTLKIDVLKTSVFLQLFPCNFPRIKR